MLECITGFLTLGLLGVERPVPGVERARRGHVNLGLTFLTAWFLVGAGAKGVERGWGRVVNANLFDWTHFRHQLRYICAN